MEQKRCLNDILEYKHEIHKSREDPDRILVILRRLNELPVCPKDLSESKIGKTLQSLKNNSDKEVVTETERLIKKWKSLLREQKAKSKTEEPSSNVSVTSETKNNSESTTPSQGNKKHYSLEDKEIKDLEANIRKEKIETFRQNIRILIFESFIENLPEDFTPLQAAIKTKAIEEKMYSVLNRDDYLIRVKAVTSNISDKNNNDFRYNILNGTVSEDEIPTMNVHLMASKDKKKEIEEKRQNMLDSMRSDWDDINAPVFEGMHTCRKCGGKRTSSNEIQMRSADEPMTIFIRCISCGYKWRIG